jgi:hypothetical protein
MAGMRETDELFMHAHSGWAQLLFKFQLRVSIMSDRQDKQDLWQ